VLLITATCLSAGSLDWSLLSLLLLLSPPPPLLLLLLLSPQVFVRVHTSAAEIKSSASKQSYVWQSQGCDSWWLQPVGQVVQRGRATKHLPGPGPAVPGTRCVVIAGFAVCLLLTRSLPLLLE
jgi:hypothetical protein